MDHTRRLFQNAVWSFLQMHKSHTAFTYLSLETLAKPHSLVQVRSGTGNKSRQRFRRCREGGPQSLLPLLPSRSREANVKIKSFLVTLAGRALGPDRGRLNGDGGVGWGPSGSVGLWSWAVPANLSLHPGKARAWGHFSRGVSEGCTYLYLAFQDHRTCFTAPWSIRPGSKRLD